jgi:hypothetical protein
MITLATFFVRTMRQPGLAPRVARWRGAIGVAATEMRASANTSIGSTAIQSERDPRSLEDTASRGAAARSRRAS